MKSIGSSGREGRQTSAGGLQQGLGLDWVREVENRKGTEITYLLPCSPQPAQGVHRREYLQVLVADKKKWDKGGKL